jgi:hypothetical protein
MVPDITAVSPATLATKLEAMGQPLFAPPNVKGWPGGRNWLNTSTVLARHNFAQAVASGRWQPYQGGGQFDFAVEAPEAEATDAPAPPALVPPPVPAPGAPTPPASAKVPEEPPPPAPVDPAAIVRQEKITEPGRVVGLLTDLLLQGDVTKPAHDKLVAFVAEGKPKDRALDHRVRAAVHAIMAMPEYELA